MRLIAYTALAALMAFSAQAADPRKPVREVIEVTAGTWATDNPTDQDVFSEERLKRLFSADFVKVYREASKHPAYDPPEGQTTGSPFDYDPIARGQDGCPFEDIRIEDDGDGQVTAMFKNRKCFGSEPEYQQDTVLIFHVDEEKGRQVIDDIYEVINFESGQSMKEELKEIAAQ